MVSLESLQERSVDVMLAKYENEPSHARQVTRLALQIFDQTKDLLHNYAKTERNYLQYAALLHDIGYSVQANKHNKHSYQLIVQSKMEGFTPGDLEIIANIARYHRGSLPDKKHENFNDIKDRKTEKLVRILSGILRLADGLDRSHTDAIKDLKLIIDKYINKCVVVINPRSINCSAELYGANKKKDLFEQEFELNVHFLIKQK